MLPDNITSSSDTAKNRRTSKIFKIIISGVSYMYKHVTHNTKNESTATRVMRTKYELAIKQHNEIKNMTHTLVNVPIVMNVSFLLEPSPYKLFTAALIFVFRFASSIA